MRYIVTVNRYSTTDILVEASDVEDAEEIALMRMREEPEDICWTDLENDIHVYEGIEDDD